MRSIFNYVPSKAVLRRGAMAMVALFVAVLLGSLWAVLWLAKENDVLDERDRQSLSDRAQLREDLTAEQAAREALEQQIRSLGEKPVLDPDDVPTDSSVVVVPGPKGERGESCIEEVGYPRCRGASGSDGSSGSNGSDGATGPQGPAGPEGPAGANGKDGAPGADGADGRDGKDGTAVPGSYLCGDGEVQRGFVIAEDGSVTYECTPLSPGNPGDTP